ncbi:MAG: tRNA (guanosine(37)-N1)-methyltransferase TrmD [Candidatus Bipolaricaulota bacterium]
MRFDIVSIFPESMKGLLSIGVLGQAQAAGQLEIYFHDLRDWSADPHRVVDDRPYGGGAGMLLKVEPIVAALEALNPLRPAGAPAVLLSPQGRLFTQRDAARWAATGGLLLICGRYEGVDERVLHFVDDEVSIGDYVLAGGEAAAVVVVEATARMTPGVVGKYDSVASDSFYGEARVGAPQYTRPLTFRGLTVPEVLLSGDHAKIAEFRKREAWRKTARTRPDLLGVAPSAAHGEQEEGEARRG